MVVPTRRHKRVIEADDRVVQTRILLAEVRLELLQLLEFPRLLVNFVKVHKAVDKREQNV